MYRSNISRRDSTGILVWRWSTALLISASAVILASCKKESGTTAARPRPEGFTSTGLVAVRTDQEILRELEPENSVATNVAELEVEKTTHARLLVHERLLSKVLGESDAVRQTGWFKQFTSNDGGRLNFDIKAAKSDLLDRLMVRAEPGSRLIAVQFTCADPKDAQTIVTEIVNRHIKDQEDANAAREIEAANGLEQLKLNWESQIRDISAHMVQIAQSLGGMGVGIGTGATSKDLELNQLISELLRAQAVAGAADTKYKVFVVNRTGTKSAPELDEALEKSTLYVEYRRKFDELDQAYHDLLTTAGDKDPRVQANKALMENARRKLADFESDIKMRTAELIATSLQNDRASADSALVRINQRLTEVRNEIAGIAKMRNDYEQLGAEVIVLRAKLDKVKDQQDRLSFLGGHGKRTNVSWAQLPDLPDKPAKAP